MSLDLPTQISLKTLYFNGLYNECAMLAIHGITQIVLMHAGRGGALNISRLVGKTKSMLADYINNLYWAYRSLQSERKDRLYQCKLIGNILQGLKLYEPFVFDKIHLTIFDAISVLKYKPYKVHMSCAWTDTVSLYKDWAHLFEKVGTDTLGYKSPYGTAYTLVENKDDADFFVIVWGSREQYTDEELSRTIFFRTEPVFPDKILLGSETKGEPLKFLKYYDYYDTRFPNCMENWLQKRPSQLIEGTIEKRDDLKYCISSIVSNKYVDPGHKYRIDLLRHIVKNIDEIRIFVCGENEVRNEDLLHIYGFDNTLGFPLNYYHGSLPERDKSVLMKYRYTLIAENHSIPGYMTEKIADGILSECLVFYWGCPNIKTYYPPVDGELPYVVLPMQDITTSFDLIKIAIAEDWWSKKLPAIIATKKLILTKFMMQHRIAQVIRERVDAQVLGDDAMNLLRLVTAEYKIDTCSAGIIRDVSVPHGGTKTYAFSKVLYTGFRYNELKELVDRRTENRVVFEYFSELSENINDTDLLLQEFSNKPISLQERSSVLSKQNVTNDSCKAGNICQYTVGFTRFCTRNKTIYASLPKAFVINLARRPDRLVKFNKHFTSISCGEWTYERFPAIDGTMLKVNGEFPKQLQYLFRNNDFCSKPSVIGCAMSHIKLWQKLVTDDRNSSYVIYEDDVEFADNYMWKLWSLLQQITFDWDMLFLGHLMCYELQDTHRIESDELPKWEMMSKYIVPNRTSWVGTASYIISKRGASKLLEYIEKNGIQHGIDYLIQLQFPNLLRAYGVNPMINFAEYESPLNPNTRVDSDIQK